MRYRAFGLVGFRGLADPIGQSGFDQIEPAAGDPSPFVYHTRACDPVPLVAHADRQRRGGAPLLRVGVIDPIHVDQIIAIRGGGQHG